MIKMLSLAVVSGLVSLLPGTTVSPRPTTTSTMATVVTTTTLVTPSIRAAWTKVSWCETHSAWNRSGEIHDGGLGIAPANWRRFGGTEFAPLPHLATADEQIVIARRIQGSEFVPDQDGNCRAW